MGSDGAGDKKTSASRLVPAKLDAEQVVLSLLISPDKGIEAFDADVAALRKAQADADAALLEKLVAASGLSRGKLAHRLNLIRWVQQLPRGADFKAEGKSVKAGLKYLDEHSPRGR